MDAGVALPRAGIRRPRPIPLLDFIPALSPRLRRPDHLAPIAAAFERARTQPVRFFGTCPPRHGKTELEKHGIIHRLVEDPRTRVGFASYAAKVAQKRSREIRKLYARAGGKVDPRAGSVADWRTGHDDGGVWAGGIDGGWTGEGFDLLVIDDPVKNRAEAESALEREKLWEAWKDDLSTRIEPGGSVIVVHTRWHTDDLGGRLLASADEDFEHVRLAAITPRGEALCPWRYDLEALRKIEKRIGPYSWESLYMGRPFARGGRVFGEPTYYDTAPSALRVVFGLDLAYSKKTSSDWSVIVALGIDDVSEVVYVLDVIRRQLPAPAFANILKQQQKAREHVETRWYYAGAELGIADFLGTLDVEINAEAATADKFIRSQPAAAAWNDGNIRVPREAEWLDDFLGELAAFTGVNDLHDDQVDALAAGFDETKELGWVMAMKKLQSRGGIF